MYTSQWAGDFCGGAILLRRLAGYCGIFIAVGLTACGGGSESADSNNTAALSPPSSAASAPDEGTCVDPVPTILVRDEYGFGFLGGESVRLEQNGPAVPAFGSGNVRFMLSYVNDSLVVQVPESSDSDDSTVWGWDVYRGDVSIMGYNEGSCERGEQPGDVNGCTPTTSLAFMSMMGWSPSPARTNVLQLPPPETWSLYGGPAPPSP